VDKPDEESLANTILSSSPQLPPISLVAPEPSISIPLHDSYVVHHFTELLADEGLVKRSQPNTGNKNSQILIGLNDVRESNPLKQAFTNLAESAILKTGLGEDPLETQDESTSSFPKHRWGLVDGTLERNQLVGRD